MPDRRWNPETRDRLTEIAQGYRTHQRKTVWILRVAVVLFFASAIVFTSQQNRIGDLADDNAHLLQQIQDSRADNVRSGCEEVNERHDNTVATVDRVLIAAAAEQFSEAATDAARLRKIAAEARTADGPRLVELLAEVKKLVPAAEDRQIDQSRGQTVLLVDALAPKRDCDKRVRDLVGAPKT